jgi:uncharacterized protein (DUF1697 family)
VANRFVALIRGINVGRAKRVAMADLRALVEKLGYRDVKTLLNSGNVVFSSPGASPGDAAARMEKALAAQFGMSARFTVISAAELATAVAENPLLEMADDPSRLFVSFLRDPADRSKFEPLLEREWNPEGFAIGSRVAYLWCHNGILESKLAKAVEKTLRDAVTARNWATVLKLKALSQSEK